AGLPGKTHRPGIAEVNQGKCWPGPVILPVAGQQGQREVPCRMNLLAQGIGTKGNNGRAVYGAQLLAIMFITSAPPAGRALSLPIFLAPGQPNPTFAWDASTNAAGYR